MIPLIPALALAFLSFICSAFVILRIIIPILPPSPLSRRVAPSEFGLPNFRSLSPADKSHLWLACLDLLALAFFCWQAISESMGGTTGAANADNALASVRLWIALTLRQTCLLIIASIVLLHVRMGRSVSFGKKHWMIMAPTLLIATTSTALAGVFSGAGMSTLFVGLVGYSSTVATLSTVVLGCLIGTLLIIKRNLAVISEEEDPWPPVRQMEEKPRPSFGTEEIDAIKDGASWITSHAGSRRGSVSGWSFSTHQTTVPSHHGHAHGRSQTTLHPSTPAQSSYWFGNASAIPPVPPLPAPYGPLSPTSESLAEPDPFRRTAPSPLPEHPRQRLGSQTSWLTSTSGSHPTVSAWSFPATHHEGSVHGSTPSLHAQLLASATVSRPTTPGLANAQVLGGYGYTLSAADAEKGLTALAAPPGTSLDITGYRAIGWFITIWVPLALAYPYLFATLQNASISTASSILLILSVTLSAPILALNILLNSPLPIPTGLFDIRSDLPTGVAHGSAAAGSMPPSKWSHEYKRSTSASVTVVEGRRSTDVWIAKGDAVDGKTKMGRAIGMLSPMPKLSVLPLEDSDDEVHTPPLPIQEGDSSIPVSIHNRTRSDSSAQFGRLRKDSKASSYYSGADESLAMASRIMIAQRHYSTLAQTFHVVPSPGKDPSAEGINVVTATGASLPKATCHARARSASSIHPPPSPQTRESFNISPPPPFPLPPTPPNVRAAKLAKHKKSHSSGFSFGPVDDMNEIDALTAGVLPLLVPGLKLGDNMRIKEGDYSPPGTYSKGKNKRLAQMLAAEFGGEFSSPEIHSTPARTRARPRKSSQHKRNHWSLPSLSLGKDGLHSLTQWTADVGRALEAYTAVPSNVDIGRRNTVFGGEVAPFEMTGLQILQDDPIEIRASNATSLGRTLSTRSLGLRAEVPHGVETARNSVTSFSNVPLSAASTVTLFEELEAGGPLAQSTPHNSIVRNKRPSVVPPPLPLPPHVSNASSRNPNRRSSIVYIKSDDPTTVTPPSAASSSAMSSIARAVRPLIPKASRLQRKMSKLDSSSPLGGKTDSPGRGLRPLSLLQDRDSNMISGASSPALQSTRPLLLGKKQKSKMAEPSGQDENTSLGALRSKQNRGELKPLQLARSETSKMRGLLRKSENLPNVVVRPPSTTDHRAFAYSFRD